MINKVNNDILLVNYEIYLKLSKENDKIVSEQRKLSKELLNKKESMEKVLSKK